MNEHQVATLAFTAFWLLLVVGILLARRRWPRPRAFADKMLAQWKPSLAIALIYLASNASLGRGFLNPYAVAIFCQCLVGLAIARDMTGFEPLAVAQSIIRRDHLIRSVLLMVVIALLLGAVGLAVGAVGIGIIRQIIGETYSAEQAVGEFPFTRVQAFFYFLGGAGTAEETTYRLVFLSLVWRITRRRWLAIWLSAVVFAVYHLTPLSGMYRTFWQFPISQLVSTTLIGLVWGYGYAKRGYETAVLAHTFSDWLPMILFSQA